MKTSIRLKYLTKTLKYISIMVKKIKFLFGNLVSAILRQNVDEAQAIRFTQSIYNFL